MVYTKTINVNELNNILQKFYRTKEVFIQKIEFADISHQHNPLKSDIGVGGVCNITFETSRKVK